MGTGQEKLTIESELKGGKQTAKGLENIGKAQVDVTKTVEKTAATSDKASAAQAKLNAGESDYLGILAVLSPQLATTVDGIIKSTKVAGDLAGKNLSLVSTFGKVSSSLKNNLGLVKLLGSAGLVVATVGVLISQFRKMAEEARQAEKAVRDQVAALDELEGRRKQQKADLEKLSALRREGPATAEESRKLSQTLEAAQQRTGAFTSQESRAKAVTLGGTDATPQLIDRLTVLIDQFPKQVDFEKLLRESPERRAGAIDRQLQRQQQQIDVVLNREATQATETQNKAQQQSKNKDGSVEAIKQFIATLPGLGTKDIDPEALAKLVQAVNSRSNAEKDRGFFGKVFSPVDTAAELNTKITQSQQTLDRRQFANRLKDDGFENVDVGQIALAQDIGRRLNRKSGTITIINNQGATLNGADANAFRDRSVNGERISETAAGL